MDEQGDEMLHGFVHHTLFPHLREKAQSGKREQIPTMAMRERTIEPQTVLKSIAYEMLYTQLESHKCTIQKKTAKYVLAKAWTEGGLCITPPLNQHSCRSQTCI